jgi:serine protease AprX
MRGGKENQAAMRQERPLRNGTRSSALWGRGSKSGSRASALRGRGGRTVLVLAAALALAVPVSSSAAAAPHPGPDRPAAKTAYVAPTLLAAAEASPEQLFQVIVQGDGSKKSGKLAQELLKYSDSSSDDALTPDEITAQFASIDGLAVTLTGGKLLGLARRKEVVAITPNSPVKLAGLGNDSLDNAQRWIAASHVQDGWKELVAPPAIAIVDTGIDAGRSDFGGRVLTQVDLSGLPGNSPGDGRGHGTFVASIAAGSAPGHAGVAPRAPLVSLDVMDDQGMARVSDVIAACDWIMANRAAYNIRVANFSLHASRPASVFFDPLDQAVEKLWLNGVVVVAAAGNYAVDGAPSGVPYAPGNDPFVLTVGATDIHNSVGDGDDFNAPWSAYGYTPDGFAKPDVAAPGRYMVGAVSPNATLYTERPQAVVSPGYMQLSGTSFSAPIASGLAALILGLHPSWTPDQVKGAIMVSAAKAGQAAPLSVGVGEVNVGKALKVSSPPNPNAALDQFVTSSGSGSGPVFDTSAWQTAAWSSSAWSSAAWSSSAWSSAAWSSSAWSSAAWSSSAWSSSAWSTSAWSTSAWASSASSDAAWADNGSGDGTPGSSATEMSADEASAAAAEAADYTP